MTLVKTACATAIAALACSAPARAQETAFARPEQCTDVSDMGGMSAMGDMGGMDHSAMGHGDAAPGTGSQSAGPDALPEHVQENLRRMAITMPAMEDGMRRDDADVAFACAMIAHHQGAIDMAQVLLDYGDDPQMIELAGEIIAAQVGEIDRMTAWLAENAE